MPLCFYLVTADDHTLVTFVVTFISLNRFNTQQQFSSGKFSGSLKNAKNEMRNRKKVIDRGRNQHKERQRSGNTITK